MGWGLRRTFEPEGVGQAEQRNVKVQAMSGEGQVFCRGRGIRCMERK